MKKKVFGAEFDPTMQPGHESRCGNSSLDKFFGDAKIHWPQEKVNLNGVDRDPAKKYNSQVLPQANTPSVILRRKGQRV